MKIFRFRQMILTVFIFSLLFSSGSVLAHEGEGDPLVANVEVSDKDIMPNEEVELSFSLFNMKAIEEGASTTEYTVAASVTLGDNTIEIQTEKISDDEYKGKVTFPTEGTWTLQAHVQKGEAKLEPDHDEQSIYTSEIEVGQTSTSNSLWIFLAAIAVILFIGTFFFNRRNRARGAR